MNNTSGSSQMQQQHQTDLLNSKMYINAPIPKQNQKRSNSGAPLSVSSHEGDQIGELPQNRDRNSSQKRHITPLRYKQNSSGSKDRLFKRESSSQQNQYLNPSYIAGSPINIGQYKDAFSRPSDSAEKSLGRSPNSIKWHEYIMSLLNGEMYQRQLSSKDLMVAFKEQFIDPELKMIVMDLKNNLFEQQYGFERQICSLVNKVTQEVQAIQNNVVDRMEVKELVEFENSKLQKLVAEDVGTLKRWIDSLIDGIEGLKKSQNDIEVKLSHDFLVFKQDLARLKNDESALNSVEKQIQDLHKLLSSAQPNQHISDSQEAMRIKLILQRMQDQIDSLHKVVLEKPEKSILDSQFMVLQNEVDNLNVKLKFHEHKHNQLEEDIQGSISTQIVDIGSRISLINEQLRHDNLLLRTEVAEIQEYLQKRQLNVDNVLNQHSQQLLQLQSLPPTLRNPLPKLNEELLEEKVFPKITEITNLQYRTQSNCEKLTLQVAQLETDFKSKQSQEESGAKLGELIIQIEADLKRRISECNGQLNALTVAQKEKEQKVTQIEGDLKKKIGDSLQQMIAMKTETQLAVNEKVTQSLIHLDQEHKRTVQATSHSLKQDILQSTYDQSSPLFTQLEKKLQDLRSLQSAQKSELLMELHDKVSQQSLSLELDFKKKHAELQQQVSELSAASYNRSLSQTEQANSEEIMRKKYNETKELIQQLRLDMEHEMSKYTNVESKLQTDISQVRNENRTGILEVKEIIRNFDEKPAMKVEEVKKIVLSEAQNLKIAHEKALNEYKDQTTELIEQNQTQVIQKVDERLNNMRIQFSTFTDNIEESNLKIQKQQGQFKQLEQLIGSQVSQVKAEFSSNLDEMKQNIHSQLQSMATINSMVTKIIEEQAKTNKSVQEIQKEQQSSSLKIDENQTSLQKYSTQDQLNEFKQEILHNIEEVKSQANQQQSSIKDLKLLYRQNFEAIDHKLVEISKTIESVKFDQLSLIQIEQNQRQQEIDAVVTSLSQYVKQIDLQTMMPKESNVPSDFQNLLSTQIDLLKHDLSALKTQNEQDHESLISKFTLLNSKHDAQLAEVTERAEEVARCFELMRESVEAVEGLIEKMQETFVQKVDETMAQVSEIRKDSELKSQGNEGIKQANEGKITGLIKKMESLEAKLNEKESDHKEDQIKIIKQIQGDLENLRNQHQSLNQELELRTEASAQELLILKKHTQDELKQSLVPITKDIQSMSETLDSYIGQMESKVDQVELDKVKADALNDLRTQISSMKKYIDEQIANIADRIQVQKESVRDDSGDNEDRMQIKLLEAQMPQLHERLSYLETQQKEQDRLDQLEKVLNSKIEGQNEQITSLRVYTNSQIQELSSQLSRNLDDQIKQTYKQMTVLSLKAKEVDLEFEKLNMEIQSIEKRLRNELLMSQESQIAKSSEELVGSVQRVEGEINKKIVQLRQIMEDLKEVKKSQQLSSSQTFTDSGIINSPNTEKIRQLEMNMDQVQRSLAQIDNRINQVDELMLVFTNLKSKLLQDHEPRIQELEAQLREIKERQKDQAHGIGRMAGRVDIVESDQKEQEMYARVRIQQIETESKEFCTNIIRDMEYMEQKLIDAVQIDTIKLITMKEIEPIKKRLDKIEEGSRTLQDDLGISQLNADNTNIIPSPDQKETPSSATRNWHQNHQKLLEEMRRKRNFYLRKTPMDFKIDEIIKSNPGISQQDAFKIYNDEFNLNKSRGFLNVSGDHTMSQSNLNIIPQHSPLRRRDLSADLQGGSVLENIYKNLLDRISPNRDVNQLDNQNPKSDQKNNENYRTIQNQNSLDRDEVVDMPWQRNMASVGGLVQSPIQGDQNQPHGLQRKNVRTFDDANLDEEEDDLYIQHLDAKQYTNSNMFQMSAISPNKPSLHGIISPQSLTQRYSNEPQLISSKRQGGGATISENEQVVFDGRSREGSTQRLVHEESPLNRNIFLKQQTNNINNAQSKPSSARGDQIQEHKTPKFD